MPIVLVEIFQKPILCLQILVMEILVEPILQTNLINFKGAYLGGANLKGPM